MLSLSDFEHLRESDRLEAKRAMGGLPKSLWETYSAFANTAGGVILLGVSEDACHNLIPTGVPDPHTLVNEFWAGANDPRRASVNLLGESDVSVEQVEGGYSIVVVRVPQADRHLRPVYVDGSPQAGTYRRSGEGDYHCTQEEYDAMVRDSRDVPLDASVVRGASLDDLHEPSVRRYRQALLAARPGHPWAALHNEEMLMCLGAAARSEGDPRIRPTRAGLLMFGEIDAIVREFPHYFLDYQEDVSDGSGRPSRLTSAEGTWSGNLFDFWAHLSSRFSKDLEGDTMLAAAKEGLANAVIHADYFGQRCIVVRRRADCLVITNSGALRVPREVVLHGGISDARNPTLMRMVRLVDARDGARGYDAIRRAVDPAASSRFELEEAWLPDRTALTLWLKPRDPLA